MCLLSHLYSLCSLILQSDSHVVPAAVAGEKRCGNETLSDSEGEDNDVWKEMETIGDKSKKKNDSTLFGFYSD